MVKLYRLNTIHFAMAGIFSDQSYKGGCGKMQKIKNRGWTVAMAGLGINLALGILYTWSIFRLEIKESILSGDGDSPTVVSACDDCLVADIFGQVKMLKFAVNINRLR